MSMFNKVAVRKPRTSKFNLTHDVKFSSNPGRLTPVLLSDVLPGDVWKLRNEMLVRFAPLAAPVMHDASCSIYHFYCPNRIVWPKNSDTAGWEQFISPETIDTIPPAMPVLQLPITDGGLTIDVVEKGSLGDYLGLPTDVPNLRTQLLPFLAYFKTWNEYFRDENLQNKIPDVYEDPVTNMPIWARYICQKASLLPINWPHDYFTSCLPFAQKGQPVSIGNITFDDVDVELKDAPYAGAGSFIKQLSNDPAVGAISAFDGTQPPPHGTAIDGDSDAVLYDPGSSLIAKTSDLVGSSITINDLRVAIKTQEFLERQARGGSRYTENLRIQWGVRSSDARLQRPEFIGMTHGPVQISEVLQTSETTESSVLATMGGHAISAGRTRAFYYRAEEHGFVFSVSVVRPKTAYQQGLARMFSRETIFDYAVPILANIGEQAVLNKEVAYDETGDGWNDETFGYQPRYEEYRHINSRVAGDFRDQLSYWHWGRIFSSRPSLSAEFLLCQPSTRIFAVTDQDVDHLWCHCTNILSVVRKLPRFGTPML